MFQALIGELDTNLVENLKEINWWFDTLNLLSGV
jgi:hypothetical protein